MRPRPAVDDRNLADSSFLADPRAANPVMHGIKHVLIDGPPIWDGHTHTGARPGKVLRRR